MIRIEITGDDKGYYVACPAEQERVRIGECRHCDHCRIIINNEVRCNYERNHHFGR